MSKEKKHKKQKKTSHTFYAFVVLLLGAAIIVMTVLLLFHVQKIEISGNEYVSSSEIAESIQSDEYTKNSLYLKGKYLMGKMKFPKAVESVEIRMKAPWSIKVIVHEKKMIAYSMIEDEYVYFDEEGLVLYKSGMNLEGVPYIEGISVSEAVLYKKLPTENRLFRNINEAIKAFEKYKVEPDRIVSEGVDLTIRIGKVYVKLGSGNMDLKIMQIPPILQNVEGKKGTLDLRHYTETTEMISFKEGEVPKIDKEK